MEKKNIIRLIIQIAIGLIIAVGVMTSQGAFAEGVSAADRILAIGNGFSVIALLYISFGLLVWISTTGVLDIFSFAKRCSFSDSIFHTGSEWKILRV